MSQDDYSELLAQAYDPKACPLTTKLMLGRKFVLPNYRAPDYPNQDALNRSALIYLLLPTVPEVATKLDEVMKGGICNIMLAASCGRPTLFLEKELGAILIDSHLPLDMKVEDVKRPFPSLRIILPKGLLCLGENSMAYLDIGFLDKDHDARTPKEIARELDLNSVRYFGFAGLGRERYALSAFSICFDETCLIISGALDSGSIDYTPTSYGIIKPWAEGKPLNDLAAIRGDLQTPWPSNQDDKVFLNRMENLALNILILLSSVPLEYEPLQLERRARTEGKRLIPALLRAKWVGDCLLRAKKEGRIQGEFLKAGQKLPAHFVRAHWRNQPYGKGFALRRLVWILPYKTHGPDKAPQV